MQRRALPRLFALVALAGLTGATAEGASALPLPNQGATAQRPPTLRWQPIQAARFYNVQVYRNGQKILSRWPRKARFELHWAWRQDDRRIRFRSDIYRWYVWPHYRERYGRLIVRSWFKAGRRPSRVAPPEITGAAREGALLTASPGTWTGTRPIAVTYRWQRCNPGGWSCVEMAGRRGPSLALTAAEIDGTVRVVATARNWLGRRSARSAATARILPAAPVLVSRPRIRGQPQVGGTLTADVGTWTSSRPLTYAVRWEACDGRVCRPIGGSRRSLRLRAATLERSVRVLVTATNSGGARTATSRRTARVGITLTGTKLGERLDGTGGADVLRGKGGGDALLGFQGPDYLVGGRGEDQYRGGAGPDRLNARDGRRDVLLCGPGADVALVDREDRVGEGCELVRRT